MTEISNQKLKFSSFLLLLYFIVILVVYTSTTFTASTFFSAYKISSSLIIAWHHRHRFNCIHQRWMRASAQTYARLCAVISSHQLHYTQCMYSANLCGVYLRNCNDWIFILLKKNLKKYSILVSCLSHSYSSR